MRQRLQHTQKRNHRLLRFNIASFHPNSTSTPAPMNVSQSAKNAQITTFAIFNVGYHKIWVNIVVLAVDFAVHLVELV